VANIQRQQKSYQQHAIVCNITTALNHQNTACQCFMPTVPLALLPLYNGESSIVWSLDDDALTHYMTLDDVSFMQALGAASEYRLGEVKTVTKRDAYKLTHGHSQQYIAEGLALIGDAAHNIHPLAGQGANLGIADASELASILLHAKQANRQWYAKHTLQKYQHRRMAKNKLMEHTMTGFKTLFGYNNGIVNELRNMGLTLVDHLPSVKYQLIRQALGN
jgi:2-octaprenylphenol hydroxylase